MNIFVTGATGWIGSVVVDRLLADGHEVTGLARSDGAAAGLGAKGAGVRRGDLDDLDAIRAGAASAEAVVHLANKHDWAHPDVTNRAERGAVQAIGETLAGSQRPFVLASGLAGLPADATERDASPFHGVDSVRGGAENLALDFVGQGVGTVVVRFAPTVHGDGDHGFLAGVVATARAKGVSAYIGDDTNRWAAIHRSDAGRVVALALSQQVPAGTVLHGVAETGVTTRAISQAIGDGLGLPVVSVAGDAASEHFGWLTRFYGADMAASSEVSRALLGWTPTGPGLIEDLGAGHYYR